MKRVPGIMILLLLPLLAACGRQPAGPQEFTIVTSFYPMYIMARNIARDLPGVRVVNLTANHAGCLHDYQLTPDDMRILATANIFVINGGGIESTLNIDKLRANYPLVPIINSLRENRWRDHEDSPDFTVAQYPTGINPITNQNSTGDFVAPCAQTMFWRHTGIGPRPNEHSWLQFYVAAQQITNIANGIAGIDTTNAQAYQANATAYQQKIALVAGRYQQELCAANVHSYVKDYFSTDTLPAHQYRPVFVFHRALAELIDHEACPFYIATAIEPEQEASPAQLAQLIERARACQLKIIFVSTQGIPPAAEIIARETGAKIFMLDHCVAGPDDPDAYLKAMERNLEVLKEALR